MELVSLAKEVFQSIAEHAASYRLGQSALRHLDRTLWVVEKCARWAVPPPLDQDERPQPELVRPLPWVFFLMLIVALRITRESISLLNLVMGKPPLRSADVVMYIQSKRRYLRTLKYQGNRMMRARTGGVQPRESWSNALHSLFEFTMCFRRNSPQYGNNNTTRISNNDEVLVVKRSKRDRDQTSPVVSASETTMERLIEKMMVDLDADTDEDTSFTLTNVTSPKSDRSEFTTESDQDTVCHNNIPNGATEENGQPESPISRNGQTESPVSPNGQTESPVSPNGQTESPVSPNGQTESPFSPNMSEAPCSTPENIEIRPEAEIPIQEVLSLKEATQKFIQFEMAPSKIPRTPNNEQKIVNGRTGKSVPSKKKGTNMKQKDRRNSDMHAGKNNTI